MVARANQLADESSADESSAANGSSAQDHAADDSSQLDRLSGPEQRQEFERLASRFRVQLRKMVEARLEVTLRARVDASDVVQDALLTAFDRLDDFLLRRPMRFDLWLRRTTLERLIDLRRRHYARQRDVRTEVPFSDDSVLQIAARVFRGPSRDLAALEAESCGLLREAITALHEVDREILLLRYIDQLDNADAARVLDINPAAASKRHGRALLRLSSELRRLGYRDESS